MGRYARPATIEDALSLMRDDRWRLLAGGTDFYPAQGSRPLTDNVLDIGDLAELRGFARDDGALVIGARTTWTDIVRADMPPALRALQQAAREVGSIQIQNMATIAGNLCNASPAADGVPPLLAVDAEIELRSASRTRRLNLSDFLQGNRVTARQPDEILTAVRIPASSLAGRSHFFKLGARRYLVISIAMIAARLELDDDQRIAKAAIAVGACSAVAQRLPKLEAALIGCGSKDFSATVAAADLAGLSPIDDVRASAGYRIEAAREAVARTLASTFAHDTSQGTMAA